MAPVRGSIATIPPPILSDKTFSAVRCSSRSRVNLISLPAFGNFKPRLRLTVPIESISSISPPHVPLNSDSKAASIPFRPIRSDSL